MSSLSLRRSGSDFAALLTPCLLLNQVRMQRNIDALRKHLEHHKVAFRPHLKTSKCTEIALRMSGGSPGPVMVSSLREADHFLSRGFRDFIYSVGIPPTKLRPLLELLQRGANIVVLADNEAAVRALCLAGAQAGTRIPIALEIDCDGHRSGLAPESPLVLDLARHITHSIGATFRGVLTHAGGAYACATPECVQGAAENERQTLVGVSHRLERAGQRCQMISSGSSPTAVLGRQFAGLSEVRAGVFVFNDLMMVNLGVCTLENLALSTLTTVIGHRPSDGRVIVDAGWMALAADLGTSGQAVDYRFGQVCDGTDGTPMPGIVVVDTNQEHGIIGRQDGRPLEMAQFPVGRLLQVLPVHACATASCHDVYHVTDGSSRIVDEWHRIRGW